MTEKKKWIGEVVKRPGALRSKLGIKTGQKIPMNKLKKAEHSENPLTRKQANLAETLKKIHKK